MAIFFIYEKYKKIILLNSILSIFTLTAFSQPYYTIDISNQSYSIKENFLKMGSNFAPNGNTLSYNNRYLTKNGKPWFPIMGEMHFGRTNYLDWESSILKMKACGIEIISTYIIWNFHEVNEGAFDWTANNDLTTFLQLCKKHNMFVWLRIGPWSHAEIRYGGFPDWLINKKLALRTNDTAYLHYTKRFIKEQAKQVTGLLFKEGGPVIGVQIENELDFKKEADFKHMLTLKKQAIDAGFDVPFYSAFEQGVDSQNEFLYTIGGYPDSPWNQGTKKLFKTLYFIKPLEKDSDIGADLFGKRDSIITNIHPKIGAEIAGGLQSTYHRRIVTTPLDIAAAAVTRVAGGLNGLGYYMFHGGINPVGANNTLEETRLTGYPNDLARIDYDFHAPITSMGVTDNAYNELKLLHLFIKDFGTELAQCKAFFPKQMIKTHNSNDTVQVGVRIHDNAGFIFLNNYQRNIQLPAVENVQIHLLQSSGTIEHIPTSSFIFPANSYLILPYNLKLETAVLKYATAQPLCKLKNGKNNTYVFFSDELSEFLFTNVAAIESSQSVVRVNMENDTARIQIPKNKSAFFKVITKDKKAFEVILLTKAEALKANKIVSSDKEYLILADATVYQNDEIINFEKLDQKPLVRFDVYPEIDFNVLDNNIVFQKIGYKNNFWGYSIKPKNSIAIAKAHVEKLSNNVPLETMQQSQDSIITVYSKSKRFITNQPGSLHQYKFLDLPNQVKYNISFDIGNNDLVKDWIAKFNYQGDVLALYNASNQLVYDQYMDKGSCDIRLGYIIKGKKSLMAQVLPMKLENNIYVEDAYQQPRREAWTKAAINSIYMLPIYNYKLAIKN